MDLLQKIRPLGGIGFVGPGQPFERCAELGGGPGVEVVLRHKQIVIDPADFLHSLIRAFVLQQAPDW